MGQRQPSEFSETQGFQQWRTRIILAFPPLALLFMTCRQVIFHKPWGSPPQSNGGLIFLTVLLIGVYIRLITVKLVTELRDSEIRIGMHGLWKRRHIPLDQIETAREVTYDAAAEFGGYGVRSGGRRAAYIAHGNRGVELSLRGGRKILIGSQHPAALLNRIEEARHEVRA